METGTEYLGEEVLMLKKEYELFPWTFFGQGEVVQETEDRVRVKILTGHTFWTKKAKYEYVWWIKDGVYKTIEVVETDGIIKTWHTNKKKT